MSEPITFAEFLESIPPGVERVVTNIAKFSAATDIAIPDIRQYCGSPHCTDFRFFDGAAFHTQYWSSDAWKPITFRYSCKNCQQFQYLISVNGYLNSGSTNGKIVKLGQIPAFGPPIPAKLVTLLGPDRDLLIKANRAHTQGLGVGSFAYYRRIVENQRNRIFDAIIKVARTQPGSADFVTALESAKKETQFTKSVEAIKSTLPASFLIEGHNPLTLLHDALSDGIHTLSDEDCLDRATVVRTVLAALARRLDELSSENSELKGALNKLFKKPESKT